MSTHKTQPATARSHFFQQQNSRQGQGTSPEDTSALTFARELLEKRGQVPASSVQALRDQGFTDREIGEIIAHVALNIFTNYLQHSP